MATTKIADAIKSIPEKKEKLRKAFETLQSHSAALSSFTLQWQDLDDYFTAMESSINDRFKELQSKEPIDTPTSTAATTPSDSEPKPRSELKTLCVSMNAKGLRSFISKNREDLTEIRNELTPAIRCAPDPAQLVLDAMEGFYPSHSEPVQKSRSKSRRENKDGDAQMNRRFCIDLLETIYVISPEIKPAVKEKAKRLAFEWKGKIPETGDYALETMGFLQLIASYGLLSEFRMDEILDFFVSISRRKQAVDLVKNLGLVDKLPDLIQKLNSKGRQLDAVKYVHAFNLMDKFPPVPLLKAYINESKKVAQEVLKKGNHSLKSQNEATAKEIGALSSVLKAIEEYKLESQYPREQLEKRIAQLEKKKADKKRPAAAAPPPNSKTHHHNKQQQQHQSNKRPRPSPASASAAIIAAANPYPPLVPNQPQHGLGGERTPYMGIGGPYGLPATSSVYNLAGPSIPAPVVGHGGIRSPPRPYMYSLDPCLGSSGLYEKPVTYGGYPMLGQPSAYGSSLYP